MTDLLAGVKLFNACYKELLKMNDIENRAREYLAEHSEYSEVFGGTFIAVNTLTAMVEFSKQETKELEKENVELKKRKGCETCTKFDEVKLTKAKEIIRELASIVREGVTCGYLVDDGALHKATLFLKEYVNG